MLQVRYSNCSEYNTLVFANAETFVAESILHIRTWMYMYDPSRRKGGNVACSPGYYKDD